MNGCDRESCLHCRFTEIILNTQGCFSESLLSPLRACLQLLPVKNLSGTQCAPKHEPPHWTATPCSARFAPSQRPKLHLNESHVQGAACTIRDSCSSRRPAAVTGPNSATCCYVLVVPTQNEALRVRTCERCGSETRSWHAPRTPLTHTHQGTINPVMLLLGMGKEEQMLTQQLNGVASENYGYRHLYR